MPIRHAFAAAAVVALVAATGLAGPQAPAEAAKAPRSSSTSWTYKVLDGPRRVEVRDGAGLVATFTNGARTVTVRGTARTFAEPSTTTASVTGTSRVRLLPQPFTGTVDTTWLKSALADTSPDLLDVALQYVTGAPVVRAADGSVLSSDASYGPLQPDGTRQEGSDFNDYLGVAWTYGATTDAPEAEQIGSLDCSGFTRMVFGYRSGIAMGLDPDGVRLPRRAVQMLDSAPGVVTVTNSGSQPGSTSSLLPGDLVFFDASTNDGTLIDHVGIFLGTDSAGAPRFVSSRKTADGPTLGDVGGRSTLTGTGYYATAWRAARRI